MKLLHLVGFIIIVYILYSLFRMVIFRRDLDVRGKKIKLNKPPNMHKLFRPLNNGHDIIMMTSTYKYYVIMCWENF